MELERLLSDKLTKSIVAFFHENQSSIDTPRGIATWVKEERPKVKKVLDKLVKVGVLTDVRVSSTTGYCYTRNKKLIDEITKILKEK